MRGVVDTFNDAIIRHEPSVFGDLVCFAKNGTILEIDEKGSTKDFYKVCTPAGVEGYCLKMYLIIEE